MQDADRTEEIAQQVREAHRWGRGLRLRGGDTRAFLGRAVAAEPLNLGGHRGIVEYAPTELVVTARAGTPLLELERALLAERQMLGFDPPRFGLTSTVGGAIATGLSGPRRPFAGAARDAVLGVRCMDGAGAVFGFGGKVIKNVAGYDLSRLMCGAQGTLGVLLDVSLKLLPVPEFECTVSLEVDADAAVAVMNRHAGTALPLSGATWHAGVLRLRLGGSEASVRSAARTLGGDLDEDTAWWRSLRDQRLPFFRDAERLWRIGVPATAAALDLPGEQLIDWCGAQRWLVSAEPGDAAKVRDRAAALGGHATLWRGASVDEDVFHPLAPGLHAVQRALRVTFDPRRVLNPGRLYRDL